jgi:2'-5' RNA ligase
MRETGGPLPESFRAFVALPLPAEVQERAAAVVERLRSGEDVRWTAASNFHLTLKFLGPVARSSVPGLVAALGEAAAGAAPFSITLEGLGAFPSLARPQVIWIGVTQGESACAALAARVEAACRSAGFAPEAQPFRAHLTLGRARGGRADAGRRPGAAAWRQIAERLRAAEPVDLGSTPADRFHLVRSELLPGGPVYTIISSFQLGSGVREGAPVG